MEVSDLISLSNPVKMISERCHALILKIFFSRKSGGVKLWKIVYSRSKIAGIRFYVVFSFFNKVFFPRSER